MPSRVATVAAVLGIGASVVHVATISRSMSAGDRPLPASAFPPAATAMSASVSSGPAIRRLAMPTRLRIHSSLVSTCWAISSLVTTRVGWYPPNDRIRAPAIASVTRIYMVPFPCRCVSGWGICYPGRRGLPASPGVIRLEPDQRLPRADRIAVLDQPLQHRGREGRGDHVPPAALLDVPD